MPINTFEAVVFNEGEPLDPDKLNKLQTNISNTYQTSSTLYNATVVGQQSSPYVTVMNSGEVIFTGIKKGSKIATTYSPGSMFTGKPVVIVGVRSDLRDGEQISVSATESHIYISSNMDRTSCKVEWIAMEKKLIS